MYSEECDACMKTSERKKVQTSKAYDRIESNVEVFARTIEVPSTKDRVVEVER